MKISIRKSFLVLGILCCLFFVSSCSKEKTETSVKQELLIDLEKLQNKVIEFQKIAKTETSSNVIQKCFKENRILYKKVEWAIEYFSPETARFINGPALDELEVEENKFLPPNGFQVMEELIFPVYSTNNKTELLREIAVLNANIMQVKQHLSAITIGENHIMDALRLQVYRIITLRNYRF